MRKIPSVAIGLALALMLAMLLVPAVLAITDTIGDMSDSSNGGPNVIYSASVTASASGTLQTIGVNMDTAAGSIVIGIYADSSGAPGALLAAATPATTVTGWNDLDVRSASVGITTGTHYWLAYQTSASCRVYDTGSAFGDYLLHTYDGAMPNPFGTPGGNTVIINARMTYGGTAPTTTTTLSSTTTTGATTTTTTGPSTTTTATGPTTTTTTLPPTGIWIPPGRLATVKFLTTLSRGTHTIRLCTPSACQTGYLTIS